MAHTFDRYIPLTPNSELANPMDGEDTTAPPSVDFGLELTRQPPVVPVEQGTASLVGAAGPTPPSSASGLKLPPLPPSITHSLVDDSLPATPTAGPPPNFGEVAPGIYRSGFPAPAHLGYLATLGLKTILTLVKTPYTDEHQVFLRQHGITHVRMPIAAHKTDADRIPRAPLLAVLGALANPRNRPILVHCNKGKHRTGCVWAAFRHLRGTAADADAGAAPGDILDEYRLFAGAKARVRDEHFIGWWRTAVENTCGAERSAALVSARKCAVAASAAYEEMLVLWPPPPVLVPEVVEPAAKVEAEEPAVEPVEASVEALRVQQEQRWMAEVLSARLRVLQQAGCVEAGEAAEAGSETQL